MSTRTSRSRPGAHGADRRDDRKTDRGDDDRGRSTPWSYEGATGPANWTELSEDYRTCGCGLQQSPIDIGAKATPRSGLIATDYKTVPLDIVDDGNMVRVDYPAGSTATLNGKAYALRQFHFHAASEHTVAGTRFPMELHLVHKARDKELAVIGIFIDEGRENPTLAKVWANLPPKNATATPAGVAVDAGLLLPGNTAVWRYTGSLTTPPCTEGVIWFVMAQAITASRAQIEVFTTRHPNSFRPAQKLNGRRIT